MRMNPEFAWLVIVGGLGYSLAAMIMILPCCIKCGYCRLDRQYELIKLFNLKGARHGKAISCNNRSW